MNVHLAIVMALCPAAAMGQYVFFDDFDGNELLPHWGVPPPHHWEYNVSNSMLNVTGLFSPGFPPGGNYSTIGASFATQTDFRVDVWMGWQTGDQPHRLDIGILGPWQNPILAEFGYRKDAGTGGAPHILAGAGASYASSAPAPAPGIHHFTVTRTGAQFDFFLNNEPFASFPDHFGIPVGGVRFRFVGPWTGQVGTLSIDRIQIIPAPGAAWLVALVSLAAQRRRRS